MDRNRRNAGGVVVLNIAASQSKKLRVYSVIRPERAEVHNSVRRNSHDFGHVLENPHSDLRISQKHVVEPFLRKAGYDRIFEGDDIRGARFAVQGSQLAEILTTFAVIECHFAAGEGKIDDARTTFDDKIQIATIALPVNNLLARRKSPPTSTFSQIA